jgi:hypothetical protein
VRRLHSTGRNHGLSDAHVLWDAVGAHAHTCCGMQLARTRRVGRGGARSRALPHGLSGRNERRAARRSSNAAAQELAASGFQNLVCIEGGLDNLKDGKSCVLYCALLPPFPGGSLACRDVVVAPFARQTCWAG